MGALWDSFIAFLNGGGWWFFAFMLSAVVYNLIDDGAFNRLFHRVFLPVKPIAPAKKKEPAKIEPARPDGEWPVARVEEVKN